MAPLFYALWLMMMTAGSPDWYSSGQHFATHEECIQAAGRTQAHGAACLSDTEDEIMKEQGK